MYFDHVDWGKYFVSAILRAVHRIDRHATFQDFGDIACAGKARLLAAFDRAATDVRGEDDILRLEMVVGDMV
jgi:hypothetical protein